MNITITAINFNSSDGTLMLMNLTTNPTLNTTTYIYPYTDAEKVVIIIFMIAMSLASIFGNILVFVAYKRTKDLQKATNHLILSLAFADLFVAIFIVTLYTMVMILDYWPYTHLGYSVCVLWLVADYSVFQVSVFGILLIAADRYLSIQFPHGYRQKRKDVYVKCMIIIKWFASFLLWLPLIVYYAQKDGVKENAEKSKLCDVGSADELAATVIGCVLSYGIPILIMIFFMFHSAFILTKMNKNFPKPKQKVLPGGDNNNNNNNNKQMSNIKESKDSQVEMVEGSDKPRKSLYLKIEKKKAMTELQWVAMFNCILTLTFITNVLPFAIIAITRTLCEDCITKHWWHFAHIMCYLNSALNPVCYALGNKNFKKAFISILFNKKNIGRNSTFSR